MIPTDITNLDYNITVVDEITKFVTTKWWINQCGVEDTVFCEVDIMHTTFYNRTRNLLKSLRT